MHGTSFRKGESVYKTKFTYVHDWVNFEYTATKNMEICDLNWPLTQTGSLLWGRIYKDIYDFVPISWFLNLSYEL